MAVNVVVSRSARSTILEHLRSLRGSLGRARDALMHFKDDRTDRDILEPAARRTDELMNMFAAGTTDPARVTLWCAEIRSAIDKVPNQKSAAALSEARTEIAAVLDVIESEDIVSRSGIDSTNSLRPFG